MSTTKPSTAWVMQMNGKGDVELFNDAFKALNNAVGIRILYDAGVHLGIIFEKDDDVPLPIAPYEERWGYTLGEGVRIVVKVCRKNY